MAIASRRDHRSYAQVAMGKFDTNYNMYSQVHSDTCVQYSASIRHESVENTGTLHSKRKKYQDTSRELTGMKVTAVLDRMSSGIILLKV